MDEGVKEGHASRPEQGDLDDVEPNVNPPEPADGFSHPWHQATPPHALSRSGLCLKKPEAAGANSGKEGEVQHHHAHAANKMGERAPEQQSVG